MDTYICSNETIVRAITQSSIDEINSKCVKGELDTYLETVARRDYDYNKRYKKSFYNYHIEHNGIHLIYNTLYNTLVKLSDKEYKEYNSIGEETTNRSIYVKNGLWVPIDVDERCVYIALAKKINNRKRKNSSITITTTMKCNARCRYCYENNVCKNDFNEEYLDKLFEFLKEKSENNILNLCWFGGEPLLNTKLIDDITSELRNNGIDYASYIITNGSLLNDRIVCEKIGEWNVRCMQITLDGTKEVYEKIKNYINKDEGDYYKIISNIMEVAKKEVAVNIRLNITPDNFKNILALVEELELLLGALNNVSIYPAFVTGEEKKFTEQAKVDVVYRLFKVLGNPQKITSSSKFYSPPKTRSCMREDPYAFVIDVDGNIYNCEHNVGRKEKAIGNLQEGIYGDGLPKRCEENLRNECMDCVFLPKCMGGCISNYQSGDSPCMIEKYIIKGYMRFMLEG